MKTIITYSICLVFFLLIFPEVTFGQRGFELDSILFDQLYEETKSTNDDLPTVMQVKLDSALQLVNKMMDYQKYPDYYLEKKGHILGHIGHYKRMSGYHEEAMRLINEQISINKKLGKDYLSDRAYYQLAGIWHKFDEIKKVKQYYDSAMAMNNKASQLGKPNFRLRSTLYSHFGYHFVNVDSMELAEKYFLKAIALADSLEEPSDKAYTRTSYAEVIKDFGRVDEALALEKEALALYKSIDRTTAVASTYSQLATSLLMKKQYAAALDHVQYAMDFYEKEHMPDRLMRDYPLKLAILSKMDNYKQAFLDYKRYSKLKDSLRSESNYKELANLEADLKIQNAKVIDSIHLAKNFEIKELETRKKAATQFWIVVTVLLCILGMIGFIYLRNREKTKEQAYQNILLNKKVATKTEEINELLTETIQHIKSKERIAENLQKLSSEKDGITLKSIIADLKASKADNAKLMLVKQNIEEVNFEFIKKLKTLHPDLTKTDIEICSFIRIGLSRKEVANLRNTSLEAIKSSRFRIKKKLNLANETSLDEYINSL